MVRARTCPPCFHRLVSLVLGDVFALTLVACSRQEGIRRYEEPEEAVDSVQDIGDMASQASPAGGGPRLAYKTPQGWKQGQVGGMRKAAFRVDDGDRKVEITVIDLAASAGELLPNVNRWRQQIHLGEITQEELAKAIRPIQVAGGEGHYIELVGPEDAKSRQAILGVVAIREGQAWFVKLWGDSELALREKPRFEEFVSSLKFEATAGGGAPSASHGGGPQTATDGQGSPLQFPIKTKPGSSN